MAAASQSKGKFEDYDGFVDKFKPKLTTDDCYTPPAVYEAVKDYTVRRYGLQGRPIIRPFWPGTDYQKADYPDGCVVIDNPPFSIYSQIIKWYLDHGIDFFLFAPGMTALGGARDCTTIIIDHSVTYDNGATVNTSFATSLEPDVIVRADPELNEIVKAADAETRKGQTRQLPKYAYPDNVLTTANLKRLAKHGTAFALCRGDGVFVRQLDSQKAVGKALFGAGYLISEKAAAEKAAAIVWELSERELNIIDSLGS